MRVPVRCFKSPRAVISEEVHDSSSAPCGHSARQESAPILAASHPLPGGPVLPPPQVARDSTELTRVQAKTRRTRVPLLRPAISAEDRPAPLTLQRPYPHSTEQLLNRLRRGTARQGTSSGSGPQCPPASWAPGNPPQTHGQPDPSRPAGRAIPLPFRPRASPAHGAELTLHSPRSRQTERCKRRVRGLSDAAASLESSRR